MDHDGDNSNHNGGYFSATEFIPTSDVVPEHQGGPDDTDVLLAMMGFIGEETEESMFYADPYDPAEAFWQWLVTGCRPGSLIPNKPDGRIHLAAGYVFLHTPGIFHQL